MFLSLLLAVNQPLISCEDYDWLVKGVYDSQLLKSSERLEFISVFMRGTDPACFRLGTKDAND